MVPRSCVLLERREFSYLSVPMARRLSLLLCLSGCAPAAGSATPAEAPSANELQASPTASGATDATAQNAPGATAAGEASPSAPPASSASPAGPSPEPPAGTPLLPRVGVRTMGLHVGGGPNDAEGKAPFLQAIEPRFPDFLRCYRLVAEPGRSGSFGVDLRIAKAGGKPQVEQPRSALPGDAFQECVVGVFSSVEFPPLKKPFVISYSLRFTVEP